MKRGTEGGVADAKKPRKKAKSGGLPSRRGPSQQQLLELASLPEDEKRRRLLALLKQDLGSARDQKDRTWKMPELTADGRTADAGSRLGFDFGRGSVDMAPGAWLQLSKACKVVFALDGSNWMPCGAEPRCLAESVARAVFAHHTQGADFDPERSGAEWWAQVRQGGHAEEAIQFHWDTDEVAVEQHEVNVHPHLSTVTYLGGCGAPTLVVDRRNSRSPAQVDSVYGPIESGMLSYPSEGKHVSFDGQLLHGTVPLAEDTGERITFLVNIWLNHRPSGCRRVPKDLAQRLGEVGEVVLKNGALPEPVVVDEGSADTKTHEFTFSRCEDAASASHRLVVPLPARGDPGGTQLLSWAPGAARAGFWGVDPQGAPSASASAR